MNARKLLDWRKLLIYTHRWMGIFFGIVFLAWFISGIAFMYWGMPSLSEGERLGHITPLDLSTVEISPAEAADLYMADPGRLRIEMYYDGRPIYRFQTTRVYADTGDLVEGATAEEALELIRKWVPEHETTVRYDAYLEDSDQWTLQTAQRYFMPVHRIAVGDSADSYFYVSEWSGEPVMKTDRQARFWSGVLHWTYFTGLRRNEELWIFLITWGSMVGALMCLLGIVIGVWRLGLRRRYRLKGVASLSPYAGWMRWHHYAGLLFGFLTCTWAFSGALSLTPFDFLRVAPMTFEQRRAVSGDPIDFDMLTVENSKLPLLRLRRLLLQKNWNFCSSVDSHTLSDIVHCRRTTMTRKSGATLSAMRHPANICSSQPSPLNRALSCGLTTLRCGKSWKRPCREFRCRMRHGWMNMTTTITTRMRGNRCPCSGRATRMSEARGFIWIPTGER